jgi:hypothetical protein
MEIAQGPNLVLVLTGTTPAVATGARAGTGAENFWGCVAGDTCKWKQKHESEPREKFAKPTKAATN